MKTSILALIATALIAAAPARAIERVPENIAQAPRLPTFAASALPPPSLGQPAAGLPKAPEAQALRVERVAPASLAERANAAAAPSDTLDIRQALDEGFDNLGRRGSPGDSRANSRGEPPDPTKLSPELRHRLETLALDERADVRIWLEVPLIHFPASMPHYQRAALLDRVYRRHAKPVAAYLRSVGAKFYRSGHDLIARVTRAQAQSVASLADVKLVAAAEEAALVAWGQPADGAAALAKIAATLRWRLAFLEPAWRLDTTITLDAQQNPKPLLDYLRDNNIRFAHDRVRGLISAKLDAANIYHIVAMVAVRSVHSGSAPPPGR